MKKFLLYFFAFIFICFILPAILTKSNKIQTNADIEEKQDNTDKIEDSSKKYDYKQYGTIKLLHAKTGEIEEVALDSYLCNVVSAEMPADFEEEALKAQAVVARTYTIYKIENKKHENADICDDYSCCQAWISKQDRMAKWQENEAESNWNKIMQAVNDTKGKIITYNAEPINAFFHANSGGVTESSLNIWGKIDYPYLKSVETVGEEGYTQYASQVTFSKQDLINKIKTKYEDCVIDFSQQDCINILEYTTSGRVKTIKFGNIEIAGTEARTLLGLKSTNFTFSIEGENIIFSVTGYGHGVGMSQTGADALAKEGSDYESIIKHFYTNVEIIEVNSL